MAKYPSQFAKGTSNITLPVKYQEVNQNIPHMYDIFSLKSLQSHQTRKPPKKHHHTLVSYKNLDISEK